MIEPSKISFAYRDKLMGKLFIVFLFLGYVYPFMIANKKNIVQTFIATFFTSFIGFCVSLYWIYIAVHVYGHVAPISSIAITLALPAILAFKTAVFMSLAKILSKHFKVSFLWFAPKAIFC